MITFKSLSKTLSATGTKDCAAPHTMQLFTEKVPSKNFSVKTIMGLTVKHFRTYMKLYKYTAHKYGFTLGDHMLCPL